MGKGAKKPKNHQPYPPEFRQQMLELVRSGRSPDELAQEFEPTAQTIRNWIKQAELDHGQRQDGLSSEEKAELARLRKVTKSKSIFPTPQATRKLLFLVHREILKKGPCPIYNWALILNQLVIRFEDRMPIS